jgi:hypothetical protein
MSVRLTAPRAGALGLFAIAITWTATLTASSSHALTVEERVKGSDAVVVATARSVTSRWQQNEHGDRVIVSRVQLDVSETLKGRAERTVSMDVPGGSLDGVTLRVSSQAVIAPGDRAVFFLDAPVAGVRGPHMKGQGVLKLDTTDFVRGSTIQLDDIRRVARSAGK